MASQGGDSSSGDGSLGLARRVAFPQSEALWRVSGVAGPGQRLTVAEDSEGHAVVVCGANSVTGATGTRVWRSPFTNDYSGPVDESVIAPLSTSARDRELALNAAFARYARAYYGEAGVTVSVYVQEPADGDPPCVTVAIAKDTTAVDGAAGGWDGWQCVHAVTGGKAHGSAFTLASWAAAWTSAGPLGTTVSGWVARDARVDIEDREDEDAALGAAVEKADAALLVRLRTALCKTPPRLASALWGAGARIGDSPAARGVLAELSETHEPPSA